MMHIARRAPSLGAAAIFALLLVACGNEDTAAPSVTLPMFGGLQLDTVMQLGSAEGAEWETFGGIWDVQAAPDGHFAILDIDAPAVRVFDVDGNHVGSITAVGTEGGTLDSPAGMAWSAPGELLVWDPGNSWVHRFRVTGSGVSFVGASRAFAFGETGFCSTGGRTYLSYWSFDNLVVHEVGDEGLANSFGEAPTIAGVETLGPELQEIAIEELTPSGLLCSGNGVLDVSFFGPQIRRHDLDGTLLWSRELADFNAIEIFTPDGMGLGRGFDETEGSHLLESVTAWGDGVALVQHTMPRSEFPEPGEVEVVESRLIRLEDGEELDRTRDLPPILSAQGARLYAVEDVPYPHVIVLEVAGAQ
jgi:hypothetical protein